MSKLYAILALLLVVSCSFASTYMTTGVAQTGSGGETATVGLRTSVNQTFTLDQVEMYAGATASTAYILNIANATIAQSLFLGKNATFGNITLNSSSQYYILIGSAGGAYTKAYGAPCTPPYPSAFLGWTATRITGTYEYMGAGADCMGIKSISGTASGGGSPLVAYVTSTYILPTTLKSSQNATCYGVFGNITPPTSVYVEWYKNAGNISGVGLFATVNTNGTSNISVLTNASYTVGDLIQCKAYVSGTSAISPAIKVSGTGYTITLYTPQQLLTTFWAAWGAYVLGLMSVGISYLVNRTVSSTCFSSSILLMASFFVYGSTAVALMWLAILLLALGFIFRGAGQ